MKADATRHGPLPSPSLPALEAQLGVLRLKVAQRRRTIAEMRGCLDDLGFERLTLPARLASAAGLLAGILATGGAIVLAVRLLGG